MRLLIIMLQLFFISPNGLLEIEEFNRKIELTAQQQLKWVLDPKEIALMYYQEVLGRNQYSTLTIRQSPLGKSKWIIKIYDHNTGDDSIASELLSLTI